MASLLNGCTLAFSDANACQFAADPFAAACLFKLEKAYYWHFLSP
jgi:hypothetical protein